MSQSSSNPRLLNVANIFTFARIILVPAVLVLLWMVKPEVKETHWFSLSPPPPPAGHNQLYGVIAVILFTIAGLTDLLDGYLARKYQLVTNLGKLLDPLADKILVLGTMIILVEMNRLPAWMAVVVLSRELAVTSLRGAVGANGVVIAASHLGKYKTVLQDFSIGFVMLYYPVHGVNVYAVGMILFLVAVIFTLWSGADYFMAYRAFLSGKKKKPEEKARPG